MLRVFLKKHRKFRGKFYDGPDWIPLPSYLKSSSYRSPTLLLFAWTYAYYVSLFTVSGRIIIAVSFLIVSYSLTLIQNPIRVLAFSLVAIFISDFVIGFVMRPKLKIDRDLPARARCNIPLRVEYRLSNLRSLSAWNIQLDSSLPSTNLSHHPDPASVEYIPPRGELGISSFVISERRGRYYFPPPIADSSFPFSIFRWHCRTSKPDNLIVYPDYHSLNSLALPVGQRYQRNALPRVSRIGESMEFMSCREFRTGDNPRHIHWPSTARTGELIVREFQEEYISRVAVIVDTSVKPIASFMKLFEMKETVYNDLEAALSLTASITEFLMKGDFVVDIFAAGPDIYHLQCGRSIAQFENILDILAGVEPCMNECFKKLSPEIMSEISGIGSAFVILLKWDKTREELLRQLRESGVSVKAVIISDNAAVAGSEKIVHLSDKNILSGQVKDL